MSVAQPSIQWSPGTDLAKAKEVQRLAEAQLEDVVALALSGDSRAATLAAAMSAVAAGLLVAAVTITGFNKFDAWSVYALFVSTAFFVIAAGLAILAAAPVNFYVRGYHPRSLALTDADELQTIKWAVEDIARKLDDNRVVLARAGRLLVSSYIVAASGVALPLAAIVFRAYQA